MQKINFARNLDQGNQEIRFTGKSVKAKKPEKRSNESW